MKIQKKIILCFMIFFSIITLKVKVNATQISISPSNPKVGDKVTVTVKVPNVHTVDVTANVSGAVSGTIKVVGGDLAGKAKTYSSSSTFKCKKEGKINVEVTSSSTAVLSGKYVSVGASKTATVSKKSSTNNNSSDNNTSDNNTSDSTSKPSTDATLKNLGIKPNDFSGFKKAKTSYSVSVPKNVEKISIYATPTNSKATVTGTGSKNLEMGKNTFNVKVTAEDKKTTKTYTLTITREDKENSQSDATLSNLGIRPKEYDFTGFKPTTTTYNTTVPNDVEKITIYASAKNSKDTISGTGNKTLNVGQNKCEIKVTSEDKKTSKTYILNVTRKEKGEETEENPEDKEPDEDTENDQEITDGLKNIEIKNCELNPSFSQDVYSYEVTVPSGTEKLEINTETTSDDIEVEIAGNENLKQGENIITILATNKKDDTTSTYQIKANVGNQEIDLSTVNSELKDAESNAKKQEWIIKGTIIAIIVLIIIYLIERYKISKEYDEDEEYDYEENENQDSEDDDMRFSEPYNSNTQYKSTASEEIRNIGLFDDTQKIEFEDYDKHKRNRKYKGRRFK